MRWKDAWKFSYRTLILGALAWFFGRLAYDNFFMREDEKLQDEIVANERGDLIGSLDGSLFEFYQDVIFKTGSNEIKANVLKIREGEKSFEFYDYENKRNIDWNADTNPTLDAQLEKVVIKTDSGEYIFDRDMVNDKNILGERAKLMLDKASEIYNSRLKSIYDRLKR